MRPPRRLAAAALLAVVSLAASGCNSTPAAATVGGHALHQSALDAELAALSANGGYIRAVDASSASYGVSVQGAGHGTFSNQWTAHVLGGMVVAVAVHQYLAAHGELPSPALLTDALVVEATNYQQYWLGFPASYRQTLAERTAELAALEPPAAAASSVAGAYKQYHNLFFSQVCVRAASVSAASSPTAAAQAAGIATAMRTARGGPAGATVGILSCYDPQQLQSQAPAFVSTVEALAPGKVAAPQRTPNGYDIVAVTSRRVIPLDTDLRRVLSALIGSAIGNAVLQHVLAAAHVSVNRQYGAWADTGGAWQVVPPTAPTATSS